MLADGGWNSDVEVAKERLASGYSRAALDYDELAGHMYLNGIRRLLPRVRPVSAPAVLDVGCGTGVNLLEAARQFAPTQLLCGIDLSPGMVAVARTKAAGLGVPAVITVGDAEQLPYADGLFDLAICNSVFHWFRNRSKALEEMRRVLRPGGQLLLICAAAPGFREWFHLVDSVLVAGGRRPGTMPDLPSGMEVLRHLQAAGFGIDHFANPVVLQRVQDPEVFVRLMATVAPHWTTDLEPDAQAVVEQTAALLMRTGWPQGFPNTWAAVEAVCTRP